MTRDDLRAEILRASAYTDDQGVTGCLLADADVSAIMAAADRYAEADRKALGLVRDLAASWTADDGWGTGTTQMEVQADCGREVLAIVGEPEGEAAVPPK